MKLFLSLIAFVALAVSAQAHGSGNGQGYGQGYGYYGQRVYFPQQSLPQYVPYYSAPIVLSTPVYVPIPAATYAAPAATYAVPVAAPVYQIPAPVAASYGYSLAPLAASYVGGQYVNAYSGVVFSPAFSTYIHSNLGQFHRMR